MLNAPNIGYYHIFAGLFYFVHLTNNFIYICDTNSVKNGLECHTFFLQTNQKQNWNAWLTHITGSIQLNNLASLIIWWINHKWCYTFSKIGFKNVLQKQKNLIYSIKPLSNHLNNKYAMLYMYEFSPTLFICISQVKTCLFQIYQVLEP